MDLENIEMPTFKIPKPSEIPLLLKLKLKEYRRVLKITKKPSTEEYKSIVKVTGLGIAVIGIIGFSIYMIVQLIGGV